MSGFPAHIMKYSTVEIKPKLFFKGGIAKFTDWQIKYYDDDDDRIRGSSAPMAMGFYHYPKYMGLQKAFDKLKNKLIKGHKNEISRLEKSLQKLENLQLQK